ncbi:MAG TPA: HPP family protein [Steroidobacteraceae bacterium]|nr:HPP family protein [Steroidobacteraceae bacterium]
MPATRASPAADDGAAGPPLKWLQDRVSRRILTPSVGAGLGVAATFLGTAFCLGTSVAATPLVPSMGASSILLFVAPSSDYARPRAVLVGNLVSAAAGVIARELIPSTVLALAVAVTVSSLVMSLLRSTHPPSGGVAVSAALGGSEIARLGLWFVVAPVLLNTLFLLAIAAAWGLAARRLDLGYLHAVSSRTAVPAAGASGTQP